MDAGDALNTPFEITLGTRRLMVARLSVGDLFGRLEAAVRADRMNDAREMALAFADPAERRAFLLDAWERLPAGKALSDGAFDKISTMDGTMLVLELATARAGKRVPAAELAASVTPDAVKELVAIVRQLCSLDEKKTPDQAPPPLATPPPAAPAGA